MRWQDYPAFSGWAQCNHKPTGKWEKERKSNWQRERERFGDAALLVLKTEEGAISQRLQAASNSWKT